MTMDPTLDAQPLHGGPDAGGAVPHDFSTNANACGPCPAAQAALRRTDASRYPDPGYSALRGLLAAFHGVDASRILVCASASEFIHRVTAAVAQQGGRSIWLPPHSYGDYRRAAEAWGLGAQSALPSTADLIWCCDPSSPLGLPQDGLAVLLDGQRSARATCVLDLAYEPLRLAGSLGLSEAQRDRVWQLWTPNKALGLTGVRAGYAIAPAGAGELAARVARLAPSWPLGAHGVALLEAWTTEAAQQWLAGSLDILRRWKAEQVALCRSLGWTPLPSLANYFCAWPDMPYAEMAPRVRAAGIQLRDTSSFGLPGLVRLGVLPPASQRALRRVWTGAHARRPR